MKKILLSFLFILFLVGCKRKEALEANTFKEKVEEKGYVVQDVTDKNDKEVTSIALSALHNNYEIEFYKLNSEESSKSTYNLIKTKLEEKNKGKEIKKKNYQKYILETKTKYAIVSRIDSTIVYGTTTIEHKKMLEEDIKSLGY